MRARSILTVSLISSALISCGETVTIPDVEVCTVAGLMAAGADCATTVSSHKRSITLEEYLIFLQPTDTRAGAVCATSADFNRLKTALDKACVALGSSCEKEVREALKTAGQVLSDLETKSREKGKHGQLPR